MLKAFLAFFVFGVALLSTQDRTIRRLPDTDDSTQVRITTQLDSLGLLDGYQIFLNTPICEVEQCYKVQLNLYCDVIGRFVSYDTLTGHELTKLDHIPFTTEDYNRLQNILSNPHSVLERYKKEELVKDRRTSEIEGFTGATVLEVKRNVIEGAVYSCHTLWHIAHGQVEDSLKRLTASNLNHDLVNKLVSRKNQDINYFLIDYCSEKQIQEYLPQLLSTINDSQGYYAKNALEKFPKETLNSAQSQQFFVTNFNQLDYFAQVVLLKKLQKELLSPSLKNILIEAKDQRSSLRNELIVKLTESP